jgi:hypothetical protein
VTYSNQDALVLEVYVGDRELIGERHDFNCRFYVFAYKYLQLLYGSEGFVEFLNGCPAKERKAGVEAAPHSFGLWWGDWKSIDSGERHRLAKHVQLGDENNNIGLHAFDTNGDEISRA